MIATKIRVVCGGRSQAGVRHPLRHQAAERAQRERARPRHDRLLRVAARRQDRAVVRVVGNIGVGILADPTNGQRQNDVLTYGVSLARAVTQRSGDRRRGERPANLRARRRRFRGRESRGTPADSAGATRAGRSASTPPSCLRADGGRPDDRVHRRHSPTCSTRSRCRRAQRGDLAGVGAVRQAGPRRELPQAWCRPSGLPCRRSTRASTTHRRPAGLHYIWRIEAPDVGDLLLHALRDQPSSAPMAIAARVGPHRRDSRARPVASGGSRRRRGSRPSRP